MAYDIGPKIGIEGEAEYRRQLNQIIQTQKTLASEMAAVTSSFNGNANSMAALTAKGQVLSKQVETQKTRLDELNKGLEAAKEKYGENDTVTLKWQQAVNQANAELNKLDSELKQNDKYLDEAEKSVDGCAASIDKYGKETKEAAQDSAQMGEKSAAAVDKMSEAIASSGIVAGLKKIEDAIIAVVNAAADYADQVDTISLQTGVATDKIQTYMYAAELLDVPVDTLTRSMAKNIKSMGSARDGTAEAVEAYKKLGLSVTDANGNLLDGETVYWEVIDALGNMSNETERDEIAMTLLGKSAQELNPLIKAGSEKMSELADEAQKAGYVLSDETLASLQALDDEQQIFNRNSEALKNTVGAALAPQFENLASMGTDAVQSLTDFAQQSPVTVKALSDITLAAGGTTAGFLALKTASKVLSVIGISISATTLLAAAGYAALGLAAVTAITSTIDQFNNAAEKTDNLADAQRILADAQQHVTDVENEWGDAVWESGSEAATAYDLARVAVKQAQDQVDALSDSQDAAGQSTEDYQATIDDLTEQMSDLSAAYSDAKDAAVASLDSQIGKWAEMDTSAVTSAADVLAALQSQIDWLTDYQTNLDALEGRKIEGVDTSELVQSLSDGSAESAAILAGLATASDEDVKKIVDNLGQIDAKKDSLSDTMADISTGFSEKMDEMRQKASDTVGKMNFEVEAGTAAADTMQGYIDECYAMFPELKAAYGAAGTAANQAYRDAQDSHSPSRKAREATQDYIDGLILQAEDMMPQLEKTFSGAGETVNSGVRDALLSSMNGMATELNYSPVLNASGSGTVEMRHSGTVRIEGVNNNNEFVGAAEVSFDGLVAQLRMEKRAL